MYFNFDLGTMLGDSAPSWLGGGGSGSSYFSSLGDFSSIFPDIAGVGGNYLTKGLKDADFSDIFNIGTGAGAEALTSAATPDFASAFGGLNPAATPDSGFFASLNARPWTGAATNPINPAGSTGNLLSSLSSTAAANPDEATKGGSKGFLNTLGDMASSKMAQSLYTPLLLGGIGTLLSGAGNSTNDTNIANLKKKEEAAAANTAATNAANAAGASEYIKANTIDKDAVLKAYNENLKTEAAAINKKAGSYGSDRGGTSTAAAKEKYKRQSASDYANMVAKLAGMPTGVNNLSAYQAAANGGTVPVVADYETPSFVSNTTTGLSNLLGNLTSASMYPFLKYLLA